MISSFFDFVHVRANPPFTQSTVKELPSSLLKIPPSLKVVVDNTDHYGRHHKHHYPSLSQNADWRTTMFVSEDDYMEMGVGSDRWLELDRRDKTERKKMKVESDRFWICLYFDGKNDGDRSKKYRLKMVIQ